MLNISEIYKAFLDSSGVSTDSRNCPAGAMFIALKGERFDGNLYVEEVLNKGAAYAISSSQELSDRSNVFVVDDTLAALQQLALHHRRQLNIPVLSITGTNGKTTSKELVNAVLSQKFNTKATAGNLNNHIGVPLTLLSFDESTEFGIVEMGANHIGEIQQLCELAEPGFGLITNVGKAHLEGFGSFEGVKQAKGEMYNYALKHEGLIFINRDNPHLMTMAEHNNKRFEYGQEGQISGHILEASPLVQITWQSKDTNCPFEVQTQLIGSYNLENILAAIAIGTFFNITPEKINAALSGYHPTNNRSQYIKTPSNQIIMDAYNANPSSMAVALDNFSQVKASSKWLILGGMKELGNVSMAEHSNLIQQIRSLQFDKTILIGNEFAPFRDEFDYFESCNAAVEYLKTNTPAQTYILIKGSRSNKLEDILPFL